MTEKTIVITRPPGDAATLRDALCEAGYRVIHEPLTEIFLDHTQRLAITQALLEDPDAVIVTSKHAVQALAVLTELRDAFLLCVGDATAETAYSVGFTRVASAGGNVERLLEYVAGAYDQSSRFVYLCGKHVRFDVAQLITDIGMHVQQFVIYEAIASEQLAETLCEQLKRHQLDAFTFFSPRSAKIFTRLLKKAELQSTLAQLDAFCLSEAIASPLSQQGWRSVHVAKQATLASLIESVDNAYRHG